MEYLAYLRRFLLFQSTLPEGSDSPFSLSSFPVRNYFNPRSPKGATLTLKNPLYGLIYFNPRSPKGATQPLLNVPPFLPISIHAPRRERQCRNSSGSAPHIFQSTLPEGSDMVLQSCVDCVRCISIHAPRRERPSPYPHSFQTPENFNPRSPKGATSVVRWYSCNTHISIHAPRRERPTSPCPSTPYLLISIHAPRRERHNPVYKRKEQVQFQSTLPEGSDEWGAGRCLKQSIFQSTLPEGSDSRFVHNHHDIILISIHAPRRERPSRLSM